MTTTQALFEGIMLSGRNESERRRAELDAFRLASIVESSDDAIASKDLDGIITSWNEGAERLFGYSAEEVIGKPITVLIPADHLDEEPGILARIRRGDRVNHYETIRRRKDGTLVDVSLTVSPIKDGDGRIIGASKIARDITKRKIAEAALAKHTEELAALYSLTDSLHRATSLEEIYDAALDAILQALPCGRASILLCDETGTMKFVAWRGLSERYRQAVEGHSPWSPDDKDPQPISIPNTAELPASLRDTVKTERIGALSFVPLVTGGKLVGKFMAYYDEPHDFTDGEMKLALAIARQFGFGLERIRTEDELRKREEHERARAAELQAIMDAVPAVIWIAREPEAREIIGNRAAHDSLRMPQEVNLSLSAPAPERPSHFKVFVDNHALATEDLPVQRAARGEAVQDFEEEVRFDDGTSTFLLGNATTLRDAHGHPSGAVAAFVDITERKAAEQQRDLLVAELSHRVKNTLATVISVARQSFSGATDVEEAQQRFGSRIRALAQTHTRLAEANWSGVSLETMFTDELAPYRREDVANVSLSGPPIALNSRCAVTLGMAVHELTTNAAKYGALSAERGRVEVTWELEPYEHHLTIRWVETGGPPVTPPKTSGFGRLLLERALASDLTGNVHLDFAADGLTCVIVLPLDECVAR